jgi:glyceraldehyde-3-phosphate dehydrogenase (ferredoxin)
MKPFRQTELRIALDPLTFAVNDIAPDAAIYGPVDYGWRAYCEDPGVLTFGEGMFAAGPLNGSRRLVFCGHSPQWEGFYISSMGGAAYTFKHVGVNYVRISGRAATPSVLLLNHDGNQTQVRLEPLPDVQDIWQGYPAPNGSTLTGIFALQQALLDRWGAEYPPKHVRSFVVGPVSQVMSEGAIVSNPVEKGAVTHVTDWCGRGGMGSHLLQQHNLLGCVFGGQWVEEDVPGIKDFDPYFVEHFGDRATKVDKAVTAKYALDPKTQTGGTFGSNYHAMGDKILSFNYRSVYAPKAERLKHQQSFVVDHYLKQYNEETIATKSFKHCGEPCGVACKKMNGPYKKDYEPYHTLGPQVGVFDQRAAELLNDYADAMGFDAIQIGGTLAWIMECVADGLIDPEAFGFAPKDALRFDQFTAERADFDVVADSMTNARYAVALIKALLHEPKAEVFRLGIRQAAAELNRLYPDTRPGERAVFLSHGRGGCMVPNQYYVPGMASPMPIMGKYYVFYGANVLSPQELGSRNVERMVYELFNDNIGMCRFHRQWSESLAGVLAKEMLGLDIDFKQHHFELAQQINALEGIKSVAWETQRMADMFANYIRWLAEDNTSVDKLASWVQHDPLRPQDMTSSQGDAPNLSPERAKALAHSFWQAIKHAQEATFAAGADAIATARTPAQQRAQ